MKSPRRLPEIDLANVASLDDDEKMYRALKRIVGSQPRLSLDPARNCAPAIFQAQPPLLELPPVHWQHVETAIRLACKNRRDWLDPNISVARALFSHASSLQLRARSREFNSLPIGFGRTVRFWSDFFCIEDDRPVVYFIDPRKGNGLTAGGRLFTLSLMHHHIARGDFTNATFEVLSVPAVNNRASGNGTTQRIVRAFRLDESNVLPLTELNHAIERTYLMWNDIQLEQRKAA